MSRCYSPFLQEEEEDARDENGNNDLLMTPLQQQQQQRPESDAAPPATAAPIPSSSRSSSYQPTPYNSSEQSLSDSSVVSSSSHLMGESLVITASASTGKDEERVDLEAQQQEDDDLQQERDKRRRSTSTTTTRQRRWWSAAAAAAKEEAGSRLLSLTTPVRGGWVARALRSGWSDVVIRSSVRSRDAQLGWPAVARRCSNQTTVLSPRSRNLADLQYLTDVHRQKVRQMEARQEEEGEEEHFDFCLVLQPQEVYAFWAELLDFRPEFLGQEAVDAMEENWKHLNLNLRHTPSWTDETNSEPCSSGSSSSSSPDVDEAKDTVNEMFTPPDTGVRQRRCNTAGTPSTFGTPSCWWGSGSLRAAPSPGLYSVVVGGGGGGGTVGGETVSTSTTHRQSIFERAIMGTPTSATTPMGDSTSLNYSFVSARTLDSSFRGQQQQSSTPATLTTQRRRWGNQVGPTPASNVFSPPVRSLRRESSIRHRPTTTVSRLPPSSTPLQTVYSKDEEEEEEEQDALRDPNSLRMEDIPNRLVARGIAARTNRTNGMLQFLSALKRGIVLRRHTPGQEATFCKISSGDGGDTIRYELVETDEAMRALETQRIKYSRSRSQGGKENADDISVAPWSLESTSKEMDPKRFAFSVPDYVAADEYRKKMAREKGGFGKKVTELASKVAASGTARIADAVAVHPARNKDPRSDSSGELGSASLRRSKSEYDANMTFSLVLRRPRVGPRARHKETIGELEDMWHNREGSEAQFKYLDFEAATEGEYWLVFRGLLLLHRDAAVGRFAKQRASGIGTHYGRSVELEQREQADIDMSNRLHQDEFHEPVTVGYLEKKIMEWRDVDMTYVEGFVTDPNAVPPPSDWFLGFRSPGTAIWSRLRQAGLETRRVYSLDPRLVMIKIRCPPDRLMDVAEVLRLKLKTREGTFAPFREDLIDMFDPTVDPLEGPRLYGNLDLQFRSSIRQAIIDFIIGSRIRDSGAELGQNTDLGQKIQAKVPLHMYGKLNAIFDSWFYFWRVENWRARNWRNLADDLSFRSNTSQGSDDVRVPGVLRRFFGGCLHQPLDSIEQYFGEKVAFYFTWLQHTSAHLAVLSAVGLLVFICQIASGNVDHPLRPYFSVVVMVWTFITLINWKKRESLMAYRWGTMNYKEQETTRPQFHGDYTKDEITGEWVVTYPKYKRWLKYCISFPLTLLFTGGTLFVIMWVHANRDVQLANYLEQKNNPYAEAFQFDFTISAIGRKQIVELELTKETISDPTFWMIVGGMPAMLGLFLPLLNFILMKLSVALNDFENYRTESEYRTFLIIKVFSFRFVCYFATLYYYAFVSVGSQEAIENGILRVGAGVLVYTTVAQWWQSALHVCFPVVVRKFRTNHHHKRLGDELREIELEEEELNRLSTRQNDEELKKRRIKLINKRLLLEQAQDDVWLEMMNPQHDSFPEYIQAVVQFTYVACFSVVLPITPLIVLFNYLVNMRLDAYKLCRGRRRPLAEKTGGIGVWEHLLHIVVVISILTNCWLMGFTSSQLYWIAEEFSEIALFAVVVCWEHIMLLLKYILSTSISPFPKSVRDAMKREQHEADLQQNALMRTRRLQHQREDDYFPNRSATNSFVPQEEDRVGELTSSVASSEQIDSA
jgi:hypothetical protein